MSRLTSTWRRLANRFDGLGQRERGLIALALGVAVVMVGDAVWLAPGRKQEKVAAQALAEARQTLPALETQLAALKQGRLAADARLREEITALKGSADLEAAGLRQIQESFVAPDAMVDFLNATLPAGRGVTLVSVDKLPSVDMVQQLRQAAASESKPAPADAAAPPGEAAAADTGNPGIHLYQHGVVLNLEGGYGDLLAYLRGLEAAPHRVLWGDLQLKAGDYPRVTLQLKLYTLSLEATWLRM